MHPPLTDAQSDGSTVNEAFGNLQAASYGQDCPLRLISYLLCYPRVIYIHACRGIPISPTQAIQHADPKRQACAHVRDELWAFK